MDEDVSVGKAGQYFHKNSWQYYYKQKCVTKWQMNEYLFFRGCCCSLFSMLLSVGTPQENIWSIILHTINHSKHKLSPCTKYGKDYYQIIPGYILAIGLACTAMAINNTMSGLINICSLSQNATVNVYYSKPVKMCLSA